MREFFCSSSKHYSRKEEFVPLKLSFFSELMLYQLYRANVLFNVIFTKRQLLKCQIKIVERQDLKSTYHIALISWLSKQTHVVRKAIWYFYIVYIVFSTYKQYKYTFFFCRFKISLKWYFKFPAIFGCKQKINNKDSQNQKQRHHVRKSLVLACPSQFLCKNEGKFIIYTVFVETWRETALIAEKLPI